MTGMLASVSSLDEAIIALEQQVDIIDLKQPTKGALGALELDSIELIVKYINNECSISATIGDLPMQAEKIVDAVNKIASTGVDYVKIGFFPGLAWDTTINQLSILSRQGLKLIAVLFADQQPDINTIRHFKDAGFSGVMLDTMDKSRGALTQVLPEQQIKAFVDEAKNQQLLCGLAGSLRREDIPALLSLQAHYLGFRGAICQQHNRTEALDKQALQSIVNSISGSRI